jgi:hypothetical protein
MQSQYPKREIFIETIKTGSLSRIGKAKIHYRNFNVNDDKVDYYILEGDRNAWHDIKVNFLYDAMMQKIQNEYKDTFNRLMTVKRIS